MKNLFLLFFLSLSSIVICQEKGHTIYTKEGVTYFTKKYSTHKDDISFNSNKKRQNIPYSQIDKIMYTGKKENQNFTKKYIYYSEEAGTLMIELVDGIASLYKRSEIVVTGAGPMGPTTSSKTSFYVKRADEKIAVNIGINDLFKSYKKTSIDFFSDCPKLVSKLENKEFKKREIEEVVVFYNENCTN
ncbi:MAG: hypothetical protein NXH73_00260 [Flavobacteriaceae bacterium]|nr:hypothetical protein [Flavobacteriaceae bacterium]